MKKNLRTLFKSILMNAGAFTFIRDITQIARAHLGLIHENDYKKFRTYGGNLHIADIGANTGQSLIALRKKFPRSVIECFEPNPACQPMLDKVKRIVGGKVTIHQVGVGSRQGNTEFFTPIVNDSIELLQEGSFDRSQFTAEATLRRIGGGHTLKTRIIEVRTIDSMTMEFDILKLDVQGLEWDVLQGANGTIQRCKPIIFIERDDRNQDRITKHLATQGYRLMPGALNDLYWHPDNSPEKLLLCATRSPT